ncbi:hypothetical protein TWF970_011194 [Orbilia oligospora]|uniref:F-box domain-containing protein n=1 Tax=Orbilia oligospora TaxID=2813651 RepID=A0A7C8RD06_ORBOL|nr:hypothetical protein TWF970_011194 [Orbilia oligospora]
MPPAITTLPSELVSLILTHLSLRDTLSLLQTCKSLYPPSLHHLYSTLHLCDRIPGKYRGPPCPPFTHNPLRAVGNDGCRALARTINEFEKREEVMPGFGYIRGLVLEPEVFARSTACMTDGLLRVLGDRIEEGGVAVRWVKVSVWGSYLETSDDPPTGIERFLGILKRYSEGKQADEFSIILDTNFISSISQWFKPKCSIFDLIDLEKVTSLDLLIFLHDDEDEDGFRLSSSDEDEDDDDDYGDTHEDATGERISYEDRILETIAGKQATDLTALLTRTMNLRTLKLATDNEERQYSPPPIERMASLLNNLQTAFLGLKQLEWLYLRGEMFHPSYFITPPPKVKTLKIKCVVSVAWWRRFANAELKGVKELIIYNSKVETASWMSELDKDDYEIEQDDDEYGMTYAATPKEFDLGSVKVEGLREFWLQGGFRPRDLGECIAKAAKGGISILGDLSAVPEGEVLRGQREGLGS